MESMAVKYDRHMGFSRIQKQHAVRIIKTKEWKILLGVDGCKTHPFYGFPEDTKATRCVDHKDERMEDIMSVRCGVDGCKTQPSYGFPEDTKATRCVNHKNERMENIESSRCGVDGCKTQPCYGFPEDTKVWTIKMKEWKISRVLAVESMDVLL